MNHGDYGEGLINAGVGSGDMSEDYFNFWGLTWGLDASKSKV